jgi:transposase-like protein
MGYDFMCEDCGHNFVYENGKYTKDFDNEEKKNLK